MNTMARTVRPLRHQLVRLSVGLGLAASLAGGFALPAFAANGVTQTVTAGTRTASVAGLGLTAVPYSHVAQPSAGNVTLTADDSSGAGTGWNVTLQSSNFVHSSGVNIAPVNVSITSAAAPSMTAGQAIDLNDDELTGGGVLDGPKVPATSPVSATLTTATKLLQANAAFGQGTYTQALDVSLTIPAQSQVGTYTGTLTTTMAASPS